MKPSEKLKLHYKEIVALQQQLLLHDLALFGSVARGEDTNESDVDFLVLPDPNNVFSLYIFTAKAKAILDCSVNVLSLSEKEDLTLPIYKNALKDRIELKAFSN